MSCLAWLKDLEVRRAKILTTSPGIAARASFRKSHDARSIVLDTWPGECAARLEQSDRPLEAKIRLRSVIEEWWRRYEPDYDARASTWLGQPREISLRHFDLSEHTR